MEIRNASYNAHVLTQKTTKSVKFNYFKLKKNIAFLLLHGLIDFILLIKFSCRPQRQMNKTKR